MLIPLRWSRSVADSPVTITKSVLVSARFSVLSIAVFSIAVFSIAALGILSIQPTILCAAEPSDSPHASVSSLIEQLNDDVYQVRQRAYAKLFDASARSASRTAVLSALTTAAQSPDLEIHESAARMIAEIKFRDTQTELARLIDLSNTANSINLPLWQSFAKTAGTDLNARRFFAAMSQRYPSALESLQGFASDTSDDPIKLLNHRSIDRSRRGQMTSLCALLDPNTIESNDAPHWALLFCANDLQLPPELGGLSTRATVVISQFGRGPQIQSHDESIVLRRIIGHWLMHQRATGLERERLLIALKYGCNIEANALCKKILSHPHSSPSASAMALLSASVLKQPDLHQQLDRYIDDRRTAHVWQLVASRKVTIRTRVNDVALALLLHNQGIDPRAVGFDDLQADPLLVFREQSLGFPSESSRQAAFLAAKDMLSSRPK